MPQAKRQKVITLSRVKPKVRPHKQALVQKARSFIDRFKQVYVLASDTMRTETFKLLKEKVGESKFLMGKNRVLGKAFGENEEDSYKPELYKLTELLKGHVALFFTNKSEQQCRQIFDKFEEDEFATGGAIAPKTLILEQGFETFKTFAHSVEPYLRQLGLPTRLVNAKIQLKGNFMVCEEGKPITVQNCKLLRLLGIKMARVKMQIKAIHNGKKVKMF